MVGNYQLPGSRRPFAPIEDSAIVPFDVLCVVVVLFMDNTLCPYRSLRLGRDMDVHERGKAKAIPTCRGLQRDGGTASA